MANSNKTVRFTIQTITEGASEIKMLQVRAKDLQEALVSTQRQAAKGINAKVKISGVDQAKRSLDSLKSMFGSMGNLGAGIPGNLLGMGSSMLGNLANPYVLAGAAIAGAGKALYDYNVELDRSLMKTAQFTKLSGDELMSLRNGIKSVADTFGKDFDTVLSSVDGMMNQFHISGEEALNIIKDGFVGGVDEGGRMLDLISRYGPAFHDAGISASELVAIIGNTRSGIFDEGGMELISRAAKSIRDMSSSASASIDAIGISSQNLKRDLQAGTITTMQALQQISGKLKEFPAQSAEVGAVLTNVFGKQGAKAGYELVTALADVETSLDAVKAQTGEWGAAMESLQAADRELENALSSLFGIADGGFSTMTTKLKAEVYGAVAKVINGFIDLYNKSILVRGGIEILALQFKNAWEVIKGILKIFMDSLESLGALIEGVMNLDWNAVKRAWNKGVNDILTDVSSAFSNIQENMQESLERTLHGQIKKIDVPVEVSFTDGGKPLPKNFNPLSGNDEKSGSVSNKKEKEDKTAKVKIEPYIPDNSLAKLQDRLKSVTQSLQNADLYDLNQISALKNEYKELTEEIERYKKLLGFEELDNPFKNQTKDTEKLKDSIEETTSGVTAMASAFGQMGNVIGGTEGEILSFAASAIQSITELIPQIISMLGAYEAEALAGAAASGAGIGFPQNLAAIAAGIAAVTSIFASLPKFADGGIITGPTLGIMGEYAGASRNPEVIAPLDKLQSMIGGSPGTVVVMGELKAKGKELVAVISNATRIASKSGKRTNIKI